MNRIELIKLGNEFNSLDIKKRLAGVYGLCMVAVDVVIDENTMDMYSKLNKLLDTVGEECIIDRDETMKICRNIAQFRLSKSLHTVISEITETEQFEEALGLKRRYFSVKDVESINQHYNTFLKIYELATYCLKSQDTQ